MRKGRREAMMVHVCTYMYECDQYDLHYVCGV